MSFLSSNVNCVSLNTRGLRDSVKRKSIFLFCKNVKANCILLQETHSVKADEDFSNEILRQLELISANENTSSYTEKWELFKFKVHQISIKHSKIIAHQNKQKETEVIRELNHICSKPFFNDNDKQRRSILQSLDDIYIKKAKGAYVRSRAKWIEDGEKSTAYFCRLEKIRQERNAINSLQIDS